MGRSEISQLPCGLAVEMSLLSLVFSFLKLRGENTVSPQVIGAKGFC